MLQPINSSAGEHEVHISCLGIAISLQVCFVQFSIKKSSQSIPEAKRPLKGRYCGSQLKNLTADD